MILSYRPFKQNNSRPLVRNIWPKENTTPTKKFEREITAPLAPQSQFLYAYRSYSTTSSVSLTPSMNSKSNSKKVILKAKLSKEAKAHLALEKAHKFFSEFDANSWDPLNDCEYRRTRASVEALQEIWEKLKKKEEGSHWQVLDRLFKYEEKLKSYLGEFLQFPTIREHIEKLLMIIKAKMDRKWDSKIKHAQLKYVLFCEIIGSAHLQSRKSQANTKS